MNKRLAIITKASLEIQERGILSFWIHVDYEGVCGSQCVGGIALDSYCEKSKKRIGAAYGCEVIRRLLLELQVNDFSEMKGKILWVIGDGEGFSFKPRGIQSMRVVNKNSEPVIFGDILKEMGK